MKCFRKAIGMYSLLSLCQLLHAAPPEGYVIQWGWNAAFATSTPPKLVLSNAVAVTAGDGHSLALRRNGTVVGWGWNGIGNATGVPTTNAPHISTGEVRLGNQILDDVVSIRAGRSHSLALKKNGTVVTWGENSIPVGLNNIAGIGADAHSSWALKRDGTIVGWWREPSWPGYGQLFPVEHLSNVVTIATCYGYHDTRGAALLRNGTVGQWGINTEHKDATPPAGLSNVVAIAAGAGHSLALRNDGTVVGWGWNQSGEATGVPTTNAVNLDYLSSGQVRIGGQVLSNVVSIAASRGYSVALKKDGMMVSWGRMVNGLYPVNVPAELSNVVAIAAGENFCLAITTSKSVADKFSK